MWAKFKYGGRSAHYFPNPAKGVTACGRLVLDGKIRIITERLKYRCCQVCQQKAKEG